MSVWILQQPLTPDEELRIATAAYLILPYDNLPDLTYINTVEKARKLLRMLYPDEPPETISRKLEQFWPLHTGIEVDDIIAVPLPVTKKMALAQVSGSYVYSVGHDCGDLHLLPVTWLRDDAPMSALRKYKQLLIQPGMQEVTDLDARTSIRSLLPHSYNRFHKWRWLLAVFMAMGMLRLLVGLANP